MEQVRKDRIANRALIAWLVFWVSLGILVEMDLPLSMANFGIVLALLPVLGIVFMYMGSMVALIILYAILIAYLLLTNLYLFVSGRDEEIEWDIP